MIWMDSHYHTGMSYLIYLCLKCKVSTVSQCISIAVSICFFCVSVAEDYKWVMMMTGSAANTSYRPVCMTQMCSFHLTFYVMSTIEMNCIHFSIFKIHFHRHCFLYCNRCLTSLFQTNCSGDHIQMWEYTVEKMCFQSADTVCQDNLQCLCLIFFCKHCRETFQAVFSFCDLIGFEFQICSVAAVCLLYFQTIDTIISVSVSCIFLRQGIQGKCFVFSCFIRISGESSVHTYNPVRNQRIPYRASIIQMNQSIILSYLHLIGAVFCSQVKYFFCLMILNPFHTLYLSFLCCFFVKKHTDPVLYLHSDVLLRPL